MMRSWLDSAWLPALSALAGALLLGYLTRAIAIRRLSRIFARTATDLDDLVLAATRRHLPFWFLLGGFAIAVRLAPVPERAISAADRVCAAALVLSLSTVAANLGARFLGRYAARSEAGIATTSLVQNVFRTLVLFGGGLLVLSNLGIAITPLLTALGVGSLAVALALQPTLSNLVAGLHLAIGRPIRVGDFVGLETGTNGVVTDIGWRATRIRELPNNIVVVPNSRIVEMILTNYSLPEPEQAALVQVGVAYGSDLDHVERVTCEVAREVLGEIAGGVPAFAPFIRYHTFGDSSINMTVVLRVQQFADRYLVTHELVKRLKARYDREGIEIPFPQRVIHGPISAVAGEPPEIAPIVGRGEHHA
jgi:small-conductance mechanosensitive channel